MLNDIRLPLPDALIEHRGQVAVLHKAGIPAPTKWTRLNAQLDDFMALRSPALDRLTEAILHPSASDDRTVLRSLALVEMLATHEAVGRLNNHVAAVALAKMLEVITPAAPGMYAKAAEQFTATADAFTAAASVVDPETPASEMVTRPDVERTAWSQAEVLAARLTSLVPVVATAASLCGLPDTDTDPALVGLIVDTGQLHRRRLWECWVTKDGDGRTGRWGALVALGAGIRALPDLHQHQPYREPLPLEQRKVQVQRGIYRTEVHDPEDADFRPQGIDPRRGRMTVA